MTVRQPWADAIIDGTKDVENRTWTISYRGPIWVHASKKRDTSDVAKRMCGDRTGLVTGHIIGSVELVDIVRGHDSPWAFDDCWHWLLTNPTRLDEPVPASGNASIWYPKRA